MRNGTIANLGRPFYLPPMDHPPEAAPPPGPRPRPFLAWLRDRFLSGLFAVLPLVLTYWVINFVYNLVNGPADHVIRQLIRAHLLPGSDYFLAHDDGTIPGAGFVITILVILMVGILAGHFLGQQLLEGFDRILLRIPVVKVIYQVLRQAVQAVQQIGGDANSNQFRQVAYITLPGSEARVFGFVTGRFMDENGIPLVTLFIPNAPSPISGFVIAVPEAKIQLAPSISVEQATKMVLSLGLILPGPVTGPAPASAPRF